MELLHVDAARQDQKAMQVHIHHGPHQGVPNVVSRDQQAVGPLDGSGDLVPQTVVIATMVARFDACPVEEEDIGLSRLLADTGDGHRRQVRVVAHDDVHVVDMRLECRLVRRQKAHGLAVAHRGDGLLPVSGRGEVLVHRRHALQGDVHVHRSRHATPHARVHEHHFIPACHELAHVLPGDLSAPSAGVHQHDGDSDGCLLVASDGSGAASSAVRKMPWPRRSREHCAPPLVRLPGRASGLGGVGRPSLRVVTRRPLQPACRSGGRLRRRSGAIPGGGIRPGR
jgi:hypothetical protein